MTPELVEAVARALAATQDDAWDNPALFMVDSNDTAEDGRESYRGMARAAIALITSTIRAQALEEAARVCESELVSAFSEWSAGYSDACKENAAAIRALIPSEAAPASS